MKIPRFWLSYDLGFRGDYEPLYSWLDQHKAEECGDGVATFVKGATREQLARELVRVAGKGARLYLIGKTSDGKMVGGFIAGRRKAQAWTGFAENGAKGVDEG